MTNTPTIYGYPSAEWNLPEEYAHCREAVLAWRDWDWCLRRVPVNALRQVHAYIWAKIDYSARANNNWPKPPFVLCAPSKDYAEADCEGFAMAYASLAHSALGIDPADIFITVYHDKLNDVIHAVCVVRTDEGNKVLDQRAIEVMDDVPDPDIVPLFSINLNGEAFLHGRPA